MQEFYSYAMLTASTVIFGLMFFSNDLFRRHYGADLQATLVMSIGGGLAGMIVLMLINGCVLEFSWFAFIMAIISGLNGLAFSFCSLRALGKINLSLYSLFSMLGGMALPFLSGILFHGEGLTVGKLACFAVIAAALFLTVDTVEEGNKKSGVVYYVGIFVFNGMSGVIAKIYQSLPFERISTTGFSVLCAIVSIVMAALMLLFIPREKRKIGWGSVLAMSSHGIFSRIGNWLLLLALLHLPASAQYPFVTGGTMIVSSIISLFGDKKPTRREIAAVALSFVGILLLVLLPDVKII